MNNDRGAEYYKRFLNGDESAFEEILLDYRQGLMFFINRYVHNVTVAEDIAADVFAEIIFKPKRYNFKVSLKTYLYMIGRSRALDWLRKEPKRSGISFELIAREQSGEARSLEEAVIANEEKRQLYCAMKQLPQDYQTVLHLVYFEDMKYEEAAAVMKKSVKQVENLVYRAKRALKNAMGGTKA